MSLKEQSLNTLTRICELLFKSHFNPELKDELEAVFYHRKKVDFEKLYPEKKLTPQDRITLFIIDKLDELELIYVNDYCFDMYDALDIYKFFHHIEVPYDHTNEELETDEVASYNFLNGLFEKHQQKVLIIDIDGDNLVFLPVAFNDLKELQKLCLNNSYFKVSDTIADPSIPIKDAFELLPLLYEKKRPETPVCFTDRSINSKNFFKILNSDLLQDCTTYWLYNNLEEYVEILKEKKDEHRNILKRLFGKKTQNYLIAINNPDEECSFLWNDSAPDQLYIHYKSKLLNTRDYFLNNSTNDTLLLKPDDPLQKLWERTLSSIENTMFYFPQIDYKKLRQIVSDMRFSSSSYDDEHPFPAKPFVYHVRHINQENLKQEILPMLGIKVGLDIFYYKSYQKDYLVYFSKENEEMELILGNQPERYFWSVHLFNELYDGLYPDNSL
ncbi:hypothetical protein [Zobellia uliginosa]|uniref:hypothetical protein n=1 Tax=Zobellia uliginosa TaxID=143224 RepID=UPI0026E41E7A|nr:hypothetical protein [Zobellia uliginosa]MDO6516593.1 hypothetical protein [Zobellia uliginosa]